MAVCEIDLNDQLRYARGLLALTNLRLLAAEIPQTSNSGIDNVSITSDGARWQSWTLDNALKLNAKEHAGLGSLELVSPERRVGYWRFTAARWNSVLRLAQHYESRQSGGKHAPSTSATICPSCGIAITSEDGVCATCTPTASPPTISSLIRLVQFSRSQSKWILCGLLLTLASTAAGLVPPYLTMPLLDRVLIPHQSGQNVDKNLVVWYLSGLMVAVTLAWLLDWARSYVLSTVSERISAEMRNRTYAHLQWLSLEFFGGKRTGDLISRVGSDTDRICNFLSLNLVDFVSDSILIVMTAAVLIWIDPLLALVTLVPFPVIVWFTYWVRQRLQHSFRQSSVVWGEMLSVLADSIPGIRVVKAFAQERREIARFEVSNERVLEANNRVNVIWSFFGPLVTFLTELGLLVVWAYGAWRVFNSAITVGVLTAFLAYISRFYTKIDGMIRMVAASQRAAASASRVFEILDRVPSVAEPIRPIHPGRVGGRVELRSVHFKYGTREVLHGVNLTIEPGEMVGLVGPSGAGKSTLVNLVCRFYDVAEGSILVDGQDIRSFPLEEYRRNIGIVLQDPFLFYGTIADNIAYGRPDATREEIIQAAKAARAHDFILRLSDGYDSMVGERGQALSGGERQRISIARALLIDPRILILDEATSSVDTETEREIQAALEALIQGRTTIAIAHRLSTLRKANRLIVLDQGKVLEVGKHDALVEKSGVYARLHAAQFEQAEPMVQIGQVQT